MAKRAASPIKILWSNFLGQLRNLVTRFGHYFVHKPLSSILWLAVLLAVLQVVRMAIWADAYPQWVGFGAYDEEQFGPRAKTLWDWMELLLVPGTLAAGAFLLNRWQKQNEIELENDRQRQAMLEAFFDKMSELLLEHELRENEDSEARIIARTRALALFRTVDGDRKGEALQFLVESKLLECPEPAVDLNGADLSFAQLRGAQLSKACLRGVDLSNAHIVNGQLDDACLTGSNFQGANLRNASFISANLVYSILVDADLHGAIFDGVDLEGANLCDTNVTNEQLEAADNLEGVRKPGDQGCMNRIELETDWLGEE